MQAFAGIVTVSVGHCHPAVVAAVKEQTDRLQHTTTIYLNNQIAEYAKELADRMPGDLKVGDARLVNIWSTPPWLLLMH
jgi:alanine-glyoxylate transaminase / (R)-3-amino-2-methylpropionate-pyruvate transaminase